MIGHPRSGTAYVSQLVNCAGREVSAHEFLVGARPELVAAATAFYEGRLDADAIDGLLDGYADAARAGVRLDCNWKLTWILPRLLARFPRARIVHLVRDPFTNVRACLDLDYYGGRAHPDAPLRNLWLQAMPRIDRPDWPGLDQLERNCAFWAESHRLALRVRASSRPYLRVRLEDLANDAAVARLLTFLGVPLPPPWRLERARRAPANAKAAEKEAVASLRAPSPPFELWPPAERAAVERLCGELRRGFGYAG